MMKGYASGIKISIQYLEERYNLSRIFVPTKFWVWEIKILPILKGSDCGTFTITTKSVSKCYSGPFKSHMTILQNTSNITLFVSLEVNIWEFSLSPKKCSLHIAFCVARMNESRRSIVNVSFLLSTSYRFGNVRSLSGGCIFLWFARYYCVKKQL
jgi:hypothetical protein